MYLFAEKGIRGVILVISNRYSKANKKYMAQKYNKKKSKYIMYLDVNNLYGCEMRQSLPTGNFKLLDPITFDFNKINENDKYVICYKLI